MYFSALYFNRRMMTVALLGFASGLPLALSGATLQAWLTVEDVDLKTIGLFALVGLPYTFKFAWAPLLDRFDLPLLGRRKGWMVLCPAVIAVLCAVMSRLDPVSSLQTLGVLAVALAFVSASNDVVFDAYRTELLRAEERGAGAAVSVFAYRGAMLVSGGLALVIADLWLGWHGMFLAMGGLFAFLALAASMVPAVHTRPVASSAWGEWWGFLTMLAAGAGVYWLGSVVVLDHLMAALRTADPPWSSRGLQLARLGIETLLMLGTGLAALWAARWARFPSLLEPWDAFFSQSQAVMLLLLIVFYKLGDAFAGALSTAFLLRGLGFTAAEVGAVNKALGLACTILGALFGGWWLARRPLGASLWPALWWFGWAQAISNLAYLMLALTPKSYASMAAAIALENLCGGMGTAAFVALLMTLTDSRFTAAQFALFSALAAVGRVYVGPASGVLVEQFGWPYFFALSVLAALPGLGLLWILRLRIEAQAWAGPCNNSYAVESAAA
jgi:PAT family beta-lactamase induction signal transducer AmpG